MRLPYMEVTTFLTQEEAKEFRDLWLICQLSVMTALFGPSKTSVIDQDLGWISTRLQELVIKGTTPPALPPSP